MSPRARNARAEAVADSRAELQESRAEMERELAELRALGLVGAAAETVKLIAVADRMLADL